MPVAGYYCSDLALQVIPITDAMKEPRKFPKVLTGVMLFLMGKYRSLVLFDVVY